MLTSMVRSAAWREILARYRWEDNFLTGPAFVDFLQAEDRRVRDLFKKLRRDSDEGSASFGSYPLFVLAGLLASSIAAVVIIRRTGDRLVRPAERGRTAMALVAAGVIVNVLLMERFGFVLASTALFWLAALAFDSTRPWRHLAVGIGIAVTAYVVFVYLLDVTLPRGMLVNLLSRAG